VATRLLLLLALAGAAPAATDAAVYFEAGVDYLRAGLFSRARRALGECVLRAPDQPVALAFLGVAAAAEGRPPAECAFVLRRALEALPEGKALQVDLRDLLPSSRAFALLAADLRRLRARGAPGALDVLAFLETFGGGGVALAELEASNPGDAYAARLRRLIPPPPSPPPAPGRSGSSPTTPPTPSRSPGVAWPTSSGRSRR